MADPRPTCEGSGRACGDSIGLSVGWDLSCPVCGAVVYSFDPTYLPTHKRDEH